MEEKLKQYKAMVWIREIGAPGKRVTVTANSLAEAKKSLEAKYGKGNVLDLHCEEDADRPR